MRCELKKRDLLELTVDEMVFGGESIALHEGQKVVFKGGIRGQKVKLLIKKIRKNKIEGKLLSVVQSSPLETMPVCPHFGKCGGCSLLSLPYEEQLKIKKQQLRKLFLQSGHGELLPEEVYGSPAVHEYKNKMEFTFGDEEKGGELALGMHMKNTPVGIAYVHSCMLVDEDYRRILRGTRDFFQKEGIPHYRTLSHEGYLRHLVLRKGQNTGEIQVNLVTTSQLDYDLEAYVEMLRGLSLKGDLVSILHTTNDALSDAVIPEKVELLFGRENFFDTLLGKKFEISPFSFFQTNTEGAECLYQTAFELIRERKSVIFDLYSGTGTIGILAAEKAGRVYGIELIEEAVEMAKRNAAANGIENCEFIAGDVMQEVSKLTEKPDLIILDPPRAGMHLRALLDVIAFSAPEILYISCNPKALMRDLKILKEQGYEVREVRAVDMFPHTVHVETVVLMSKVEGK